MKVNEHIHRIVIEKQSNLPAKLSISLAILGFVFSLIPFLGWLLLPLWVLAFLLGMIGMLKKYNRGYAVAGVLLSMMTVGYKVALLTAIFG